MAKSLSQVAARLLVRISKYHPLQTWLHRLGSDYKHAQLSSSLPPGLDIPEILPINARPDEVQHGTRLNLMVPAVSSRHVFGGIETALQVFDVLRHHFDQVRIIVTDETAPEPRPGTYYYQWPIISLDSTPLSEDHIVAAGSRWSQTLAIHSQDYFMATAWWTAHSAFALLVWQQRKYLDVNQRRLLYLIQDFEPGFYPWSARYVLAQSTYAKPECTVALINSQWLADYLLVQGHQFSMQQVLHPKLHPKLTVFRNSREHFHKERLLLVYGRPGTDRNVFALIVAALRLWAQSYPYAASWQIVSAGESFEPIDLGHACQLQSLGKLSIDAYADLLSRSAVGLSLMISPHPSYPPLEMAAFGVRVVTNKFANKNLSTLSSFLNSVDQSDPDSLARALTTLTGKFDECEASHSAVARSDIDWKGDYLQSEVYSWTWAPEIADAVLGTSGTPPFVSTS